MDADVFATRVEDGAAALAAGDAARAAAILAEALATWCGPAHADVADAVFG